MNSYSFILKCSIASCMSGASPTNTMPGNVEGTQVPLYFCDAHMLHIVALQRQQALEQQLAEQQAQQTQLDKHVMAQVEAEQKAPRPLRSRPDVALIRKQLEEAAALLEEREQQEA